MALDAYVGSFNIRTNKGQQAITGVGFTPKVIIFWWNRREEDSNAVGSSHAIWSMGWTAGVGAERAVGANSEDAQAASDTRSFRSTAGFYRVQNPGSGTIIGLAELVSFDGDGFTLELTDNTIGLRIGFLALAGTDITDVAVGSVTLDGTGAEVVTDPGFEPDFLLIGGAGDADGDDSGPGFSYGMATGPDNQFVIAGLPRNGQADSDTGSYGYSGEVCAMLDEGNTSAIANRAEFTQFTADGFDLDVLEAGETRWYEYLVIQGAVFSVGDLLTRTDGNDIVVSGLPVDPIAAMFLSHCLPENTQDTPVADINVSMGAASALDERVAHCSSDQDGLATTECASAIQFDSVLAKLDLADGIAAEMDLDSFDSGGFTTVMDVVEPSAASFVGYVAIGPAADAGQTVNLSSAAATWGAGATSIAVGAVSVATSAAAGTWSAAATSVALVAQVTLAAAAATWGVGATSIQATAAIDLSPAVATWTAPATNVTTGPVSAVLSPAVGTWTAPAISVLATNAIALSPAAGTWIAPATAVQLGPVTATLSPATSAWAAAATTVGLGPIAATLSAAAGTWTAGTTDVTQGVVVGLSPAKRIWYVGATSIGVGPVAVGLSPAVGSWTAGATSVQATNAIALSPAVGTWSAGATSVGVGPLSAALSPAVGTWTAAATSTALGPVSVTMSPAIGTWTAGVTDVIQGEQFVGLSAASATWAASATSVGIGAVQVTLSAASGTWTAAATTVAVGPVSVTLSPAIGTWTAGATSVAVGAVSVTLSPAIGTWTAGTTDVSQAAILVLSAAPGTWTAGATSVALGGVSVTLSPVVSTWSAGATSVAATGAVVLSSAAGTWTAAATSVGVGAVQVTLSPAIGTWAAGATSVGLGAVQVILSPAVGIWTAGTTSVIGPQIVILSPAVATWVAAATTVDLLIIRLAGNRGFFGQQFFGAGFDPLPQEYWDDLRVPLTRDKQGQGQKPDYDFTELGLLFPQNNATEIVYLILQIPHAMVVGSPLRPHIHYVQDEATFPVFKIDYRWYENGADPTGSFTTLTAANFAFSYVSGSILQVVSFPEIDGSAIASISSILDIKLYRDDNIVSGDVLAKEFDIHYKTDGRGSALDYAK